VLNHALLWRTKQASSLHIQLALAARFIIQVFLALPSLRFLHIEFFKCAAYFQSMNLTVEQVAEEALALPSEARALLADRLVESLDPAEDGLVRQLWVAEARRRRDDVRSGRVKTVPGDEALAQVKRAVAK
jgi:putative addiction module component